MHSILKYAKPYRKQLILGPIFKFIEAVFELLLPLLMARLIDQGIRKNNLNLTFKLGALMIIMSTIGLGAVLICQYYASVASQGFGTNLRRALLEKINQFSFQNIDYFGSSTLITRITSDINQCQIALAMLIRLVIRAPFLSIGSIIMAFVLNAQMALIFIFILPLFAFVLYFIMKKTIPFYRLVQSKVDAINLIIGENLSGVRVIRAFAKRDSEKKRVHDATTELATAYTHAANWAALMNPLTTLILNIGMLSILYFGGIEVQIGQLSQGDTLALINYLTQMILALTVVANLVVVFTRSAASAQRLGDVLETKSLIENEPKQLITFDEKSSSSVSFDAVSFRYQEKAGLVLEKISFQLKKGQMLGITGPTGSGKSTLWQLLLHFYEASEGKITYSNVDVCTLPNSLLRQQVGVVPQKSTLFSGSIADNLRFGHPDADETAMWWALKVAQADDFVRELPDQLNSRVEADGKNFSGGQVQRLAIARALIKKPHVLILDDSLSALDYQTDLNLRQDLATDLPDTTLILISQRLSSIKRAAQILVLDEGKQVGLGTHEQLLEQNAFYQELVHSQER